MKELVAGPEAGKKGVDSAIGDTVNLASRLEGQTKFYNASILIGAETQAQVPDFATLELDLIQVKGKTAPVRVHALLGDEDYARAHDFPAWKDRHDKMIAAYRARDFDGAAALLGQGMDDLAAGRLGAFYRLYADRIADLKKNPPPDDWDGLYIAESK